MNPFFLLIIILRELYKKVSSVLVPEDPDHVLVLWLWNDKILLGDITFHTVAGVGIRENSLLQARSQPKAEYKELVKKEYGDKLERFLDDDKDWLEMEDKEWEVKWEKEKIEERAIKKAETDDFELEPCSIKHKREEIERKVKIAQKISRRKAKEEQKLVMVVGSKDDPYDMDEMLANIQGPKDDNQSKEKARKEANKGKKKGGRMRDPVLVKSK